MNRCDSSSSSKRGRCPTAIYLVKHEMLSSFWEMEWNVEARVSLFTEWRKNRKSEILTRFKLCQFILGNQMNQGNRKTWFIDDKFNCSPKFLLKTDSELQNSLVVWSNRAMESFPSNSKLKFKRAESKISQFNSIECRIAADRKINWMQSIPHLIANGLERNFQYLATNIFIPSSTLHLVS